MRTSQDRIERPPGDGPGTAVPRHPWAPSSAEAAALLAAAALLLLSWGLQGMHDASSPMGVCREDFLHRIDVRTACEGELALLPGIGFRRARRITEARALAGALAPAREILTRSGLSPKMQNALAPWAARGAAETPIGGTGD